MYARQLTRELLTVDSRDQYTLFFAGQVHPEFRELQERFQSIVLPVREEVFGKQVFTAAMCNALQLDLIHFPALPPPVACFRPFIWTLHDATPWLYPRTLDLKGRLYFRWVGRWAARFSKALITVSNDAKRCITEALPFAAGKIRVIYEGVDETFAKSDDREWLNSVRDKYRLPNHFVLSVGTLEPRKNLPFLVDAYLRLCSVTEPDLGLVITGRSGWNSQEIELSLSKAGKGIRITGFVPKEDLVALYNLADVLVLPSIHEGFGFPPLEAMASGCPVIVSNRGSLPEIVGDAALLINPENVSSLEAALRSVLSNPSLRGSLVERGFARAKEFSWRITATKTRDLYSEIGGQC